MLCYITNTKSRRKHPAYNGLGQRVSQEVSSVATEYLLDVQPGLWKVIAATASDNTDRFIHDPMGIAQHEDNSGDWRWMAKDGLGTVRSVYDDTLTEVYDADRDPYGDLIAATGSNPTPFEYTGEPEDQNGLLHLRARYYDPSLAVFNSLDPLETANRYAYVNGDPVNMADPSGNAACSAGSSGASNTIEDLLPELPLPDVMSITLSDGSPCVGNAQKLSINNSYGVRLNTDTVCWTVDRVADVREAFRQVDNHPSIDFRSVFDGLEFRLTTGVVYGETKGKSLVEWSMDGILRGIDVEGFPSDIREAFRAVIIHELGHVLENRTRHLGRNGMLDVALTDDARVLVIPPRADVFSSITPSQNQGPVETIADYFRFWIERSDNMFNKADADPEDIEIARVYWFGGEAIWDSSAGRFIFAVPQTTINSSPSEADFLLDGVEASAGGSYRMRSPGIVSWLSNSRP